MTKKILSHYKAITCAVFCILFSFSFASAQSLDSIYSHTATTPYEVLDQADVFSPEEEQILLQQLKAIESTHTAEGAIVTINTTDGQAMVDVSVQIGRQWGLGKKTKNNGFVILLAIEDKQWFIAPGKDLEGTIPDLRANQIGQLNFPSNFRADDYATGVSQALDDINNLLANDPTVIAKYEEKDKESIYTFLFFIAILLGFIKTNLFVLSGPKKQYFARSFGSSLGIAFLLSLLTAIPFFFMFMLFFWPIELVAIFGEKTNGNNDFFDSFGSGSFGSGGGFSSGGGFGGGGGFSGGGSGGSW